MGKLIIISAPSGSGKTTIVKQLLQMDLGLEFSISATSRAARAGELHGKDYYFLSTEEFSHKIQNDVFLEWEEVYTGSYYGTLKSELDRIWSNGRHVIFDVDVQGGVSIKNKFPANSMSIFIMPPSIEELERRLRGRSTDTEEVISHRLEKARFEISFSEQFDRVVINDNLQTAINEVTNCIKSFIQE